MNKNLGQQIKSIRLAKNFPQRYVAVASGISQSYLSRIENNEVAISDTQLENLSQIFELSVVAIKSCKVKKIDNDISENNIKKLIEQYEKLLDMQNTMMLQKQIDNEKLQEQIQQLQRENTSLAAIINERRRLNVVKKTKQHQLYKFPTL